MHIIKKFDSFLALNEYVAQNPEIVQRWRKASPLAWRRILVVKTDRDAAAIISATLLVRIYAWIRHPIPAFGNFYAKKLGSKRVEFLNPSQLSPPVRKISLAAKPLVQPKPAAPVVAPAQEPQNQFANPAILQRAQKAMERAESMPKGEKLQILDWISNQLAVDHRKYGHDEFQNILKTIKAARSLIANAEWWEAYAVRVQNSRKKPPTDFLTFAEIKNTIHAQLGIVAHPESNDVAPVLRSFGTTFVSGLLAARELSQETEFLKYAVSGDDICLEGRAKSAGGWIENNVFTSIAIDVDPHRHDYMQASYGYVAAFKET